MKVGSPLILKRGVVNKPQNEKIITKKSPALSRNLLRVFTMITSLSAATGQVSDACSDFFYNSLRSSSLWIFKRRIV